MYSKKRGRDRDTDDEDMMTILLAPAAGPHSRGPKQELQANMHIVRSCCSCGGGLPKDAAAWDLSTLLVGGEPVQRDTVVAWLNCAYLRITDEQYEEQDEDQRGTVTGLTRLLAFADAVGSQRGIIAACADLQRELQLVVTLPTRPGKPGTTLRLLTDGGAYSYEPYPYASLLREPLDGSTEELLYCSPTEQYSLGPLLPFEGARTNEHAAGMLEQAALQQTEALLFEAQRLELQDLVQRMLHFVASCAHRPACILFGRLGEVFTDRLLDAMLPPGCTQVNKDAWINSLMCTPCSFVGSACVNKLFSVQTAAPPSSTYATSSLHYPWVASPLFSDAFMEPLKFNATLHDDLMGASAGDQVQVELDLFRKGTMSVGQVSWPVQLLLGNPILSYEDRDDLMSSAINRFRCFPSNLPPPAAP